MAPSEMERPVATRTHLDPTFNPTGTIMTLESVVVAAAAAVALLMMLVERERLECNITPNECLDYFRMIGRCAGGVVDDG